MPDPWARIFEDWTFRGSRRTASASRPWWRRRGHSRRGSWARAARRRSHLPLLRSTPDGWTCAPADQRAEPGPFAGCWWRAHSPGRLSFSCFCPFRAF